MTTLHLATILASDTTHREPTTMPAADQYVLLHCINQGIAEWFRLAPAWLKKKAPLAFALPAPAAITFTTVAGSNAIAIGSLTGTGFASASQLIGCTCVCGTFRARLTSTGTLDYPWTGASGDHSFTVYADAVQLDDSIAHIERVLIETGGRETVLEAIGIELAQEIAIRQETGVPRNWCGESIATVGGAESAPAQGFVEGPDYLITPTGGKIPIIREES